MKIGKYRPIDRLCEVCGASFQTTITAIKRGGGRYCSRACWYRHYAIRDVAAAFWARVDRSDPDGCWPWTGALMSGGYGLLTVHYESKLAHRMAYELTYGPLGPDECALHKCDNRPCCRPDHLFKGSIAENNADKVAKGRLVSGFAVHAARRRQASAA